MEIVNNSIVSLRYTMKDDKGRLLENHMDKEPVEFLYGSGQILPELEAHLKGMHAGQTAELSFALEFGTSKTNFHSSVIIDNVRLATEAELSAGTPTSKVTTENCGPDCNC